MTDHVNKELIKGIELDVAIPGSPWGTTTYSTEIRDYLVLLYLYECKLFNNR